MTDPITLTERQVSDTILRPTDPWGPRFWTFGERLVEAPNGTLRDFHTQNPFVMTKLAVFANGLLINPSLYAEISEGHLQFVPGQAPAEGVVLLATYIHPGTVERARWVFNEAPGAGETPNSVRVVFHTDRPIETLAAAYYDYLLLEPTVDYSVTGESEITFTFAPATGHTVFWSYIATS
jgi:hypothetical protein